MRLGGPAVPRIEIDGHNATAEQLRVRSGAGNRAVCDGDGFDEALLTGPDAAISEGGITNIGFFDGTGIVWPAAPALRGITMQVLELHLSGHGLSPRCPSRGLRRAGTAGTSSAAILGQLRTRRAAAPGRGPAPGIRQRAPRRRSARPGT